MIQVLEVYYSAYRGMEFSLFRGHGDKPSHADGLT